MDIKLGHEGAIINPFYRRSAVLKALLGKFIDSEERRGVLRPDRPMGPVITGKAGAVEEGPKEGVDDDGKGTPRTNGA